MYYESEGRSYDCKPCPDQPITQEDVQQLCEELQAAAQDNSRDEAQRNAIKPVTPNVLVNWGVLAETEQGLVPTNAYRSLRGLDAFHSKIQCAVFKGTTRRVFVDRREYTGTLWEQVEAAFQFVLRNIHLGASLNGIYRQDIYELPPASIRELIVNAVVHCSFIQPSLIQVALYDDRLEITSPGGLLPGVTVEKMKEGYSKIRNHAIATAFSYMRLIEQWGSGIPRILSELKDNGLRELEFLDGDTDLRINLYRNTDTKLDTKSDTNDTKKQAGDTKDDAALDVTQRLLQFLRTNPQITQQALAKQLGISSATVKRLTAQLQASGTIQRIGSRRNGYWQVLE